MQHLPVSITQELSDMVLFQHTVQAISKHLDYLPVYKQTGMHFTQISETAWIYYTNSTLHSDVNPR